MYLHTTILHRHSALIFFVLSLDLKKMNKNIVSHTFCVTLVHLWDLNIIKTFRIITRVIIGQLCQKISFLVYLRNRLTRAMKNVTLIIFVPICPSVCPTLLSSYLFNGQKSCNLVHRYTKN